MAKRDLNASSSLPLDCGIPISFDFGGSSNAVWVGSTPGANVPFGGDAACSNNTLAIASGTERICLPRSHTGTSTMLINWSITSVGETPDLRHKEIIRDKASAIALSLPPALPWLVKTSNGCPSLVNDRVT